MFQFHAPVGIGGNEFHVAGICFFGIIGGLDDLQTEPVGLFGPVFDLAAVIFLPFFLVGGVDDKINFRLGVCGIAGAHEFFRRGGFAFTGDDRFAAFFVVLAGTARAEIFVHFSYFSFKIG